MQTGRLAYPAAAFVAALAFALPASANTGESDLSVAGAAMAERYTVQFVIGEGETVLGRPRLRVAANTPVSMTLPGQSGYRMTITIKPGSSANSKLTASMALTPANGSPLTAPPFETVQGEVKTVNFERPGGDGTAQAPLTVKLTVL